MKINWRTNPVIVILRDGIEALALVATAVLFALKLGVINSNQGVLIAIAGIPSITALLFYTDNLNWWRRDSAGLHGPDGKTIKIAWIGVLVSVIFGIIIAGDTPNSIVLTVCAAVLAVLLLAGLYAADHSEKAK